MATVNGTNLIVSIGGTAQGHAKECDLDITNAARDITSKASSGWKDTAADGLRAWKVSGKGLVDFSDTVGVSSIFAAFTNRASVSVTFGIAGTGNKYYSGTGVIKDLKVAGPVEDNATYDFEIEGAGVLTETTHT